MNKITLAILILICHSRLSAWEFMYIYSDTNSFSNIVETEYCKSQIVVVGKVISTTVGSSNYSYFPPMPFDSNHSESRIKVDTLLKGSFKDTLSVFCGLGKKIMFKSMYSPSCWLNEDEEYVLFLRIDTLASKQIGKPIYYFYLSSSILKLREIISICRTAESNNCKNNVKPIFETYNDNQSNGTDTIKKKEKP
jgi:hypothetical protein